MYKGIQIGLSHLVIYAITTILWIISFRSPLLRSTDIFFYRGLGLIIIFGIIAAFAVFLMKKLFLHTLTGHDIILQFFIFCCVNTVLFTHLPVTADRSISVFMLGYLADHKEDSFTEKEIEDFFIRRYVKDFGAFEKRLHEQEATGTIKRNEDGSVQITPEGLALMQLYGKTADWFNLNDQLIHPK